MKAQAIKKNKKGAPKWLGFAIIVSITFMLALVINLRAYSTMSREAAQHELLKTQIENLTTENVALQNEIHGNKNDKATIEREAKRIGLGRSEEKVPLPAN
jgi:cell division protein FtsB